MRILAIGAHLDDIEIAMGGTIAQAVKNKHKVKMLIMSESNYNNYDGKILRTKKQALTEGLNAITILGVNNYEILDFPAKDIYYNSKSVEAINKIVDEFNPKLIFTHWIFDTHQAHKNTALATISACRHKNNILMYEPMYPSGRSYVAFRSQIYIDISDTINIKLKSLKAHKSQYKKYGKNWIKAIKGRAKLKGFDCDKNYAEVFEPVRLEMDL